MTHEHQDIHELNCTQQNVPNHHHCDDRGYLIAQKELNQTLEELKEEFVTKLGFGRPARLDLTVQSADNSNNDHANTMMYVFFPDDAKIGIKQIQGYVAKMAADKVQRAIVIVRQGLDPSTRQAMKDVKPAHIMKDLLGSEKLINIREHEHFLSIHF